MKRWSSILLAVALLAALFALPASADVTSANVVGGPAPTVVEPNDIGDITVSGDGDYTLKAGEYTVSYMTIGALRDNNIVLTVPEDATVTVEGNFSNFGTIHVLGTLFVKMTSQANFGCIHVGCGGKLKGALGGNGTYIYDEHVFEDGVCSVCGKSEGDTAKEEPTEIKHNSAGGIELFNKDDVVLRGGEYTANLIALSVFGTYDVSFTIAQDTTLTVRTSSTNNGTLHVLGTLIVPHGLSNFGTVHIGCGGKVEGKILGAGKVLRDEHSFDENGICTACGFVDMTVHVHDFTDGVCVCGEEPEAPAGFTLGEGSLTVLVGVGCFAVGFVAAMLIFKKKNAANSD